MLHRLCSFDHVMATVPVNARSRRTRSELLEAAIDLITERGFAAVSMGAVAERAGVTRRSVYLHFGSRAELVESLFDHVAETAGLEDSLRRVFAASDPGAALDEWARHLAEYHTRLIGIDRAVRSLAMSDPEADAHRRRADRARLDSCRRLMGWAQDEGLLASQWTTASAAEALAGLSSSDLVQSLLVDGTWSADAFRARIGGVLRAAFLTPGESTR